MTSRLLTATSLLLVAAAPVGAGDKAVPLYTTAVAPILFDKCVTCHRPGEAAPFSLTTYADVKKRGKLIAEVTKSHQMPPWKAGKGDFALGGERHLSDAQVDVIAKWVEAGMPEGPKERLPALPAFADGWRLGKPDLVVKMPKGFKVAAEGRDIYRNFAIPLGLTEDKWVKAIDFRPSATSVVHHTLFFLDTTGTAYKKEADSGEVGFKSMGRGGALSNLFGGLSGDGGKLDGSKLSGGMRSLGGWALGAQARSLPDGLAYQVTKGSDLILSTHFHPSGKAEEEQSVVALYFTDTPPKQRFTGIQLPFGFGIATGLNIAPGDKNYTIEDSFTLPVDAKAFGISAHAHYLAKDFTVTATFPDGAVKTLLTIPDWDFAWQEQYRFADYVSLPKGTKLHAKITYDNSADNPRNPAHPPKRVRWGRESTDEMGSITLQVVAAQEGEFTKLQEGYYQHIRDDLIKRFPKLKKGTE